MNLMLKRLFKMKQTPENQILDNFNLRHTDSRHKVLEILSAHRQALAHSDIELEMSKEFDRVTIYRTLKTFLEKGIIHKVLDDIGSVKYALCKDQCSTQDHNHDHVHFKCNICNLTTCIDETSVPKIKLPAGYTRLEINMLVQGVCPACQPLVS